MSARNLRTKRKKGDPDKKHEKEITVQKWPMKVLIFNVGQGDSEGVGQEQTADFRPKAYLHRLRDVSKLGWYMSGVLTHSACTKSDNK